MQYGMAFDDNVRPGDEVVEHAGVRILVDDFSAPYIRGSEIDYVDSLTGPQRAGARDPAAGAVPGRHRRGGAERGAAAGPPARLAGDGPGGGVRARALRGVPLGAGGPRGHRDGRVHGPGRLRRLRE